MSKSKIFIGICVSFTLGIFFGSEFTLSSFMGLWMLGVLAAGLGVCYVSRQFLGAWVAFFLFFVVLGVLRINESQGLNQFSPFLGTLQKFEGYIVEDVDIREDRQLLVFQPKDFSQRILITTTKTQEFFYGDWVLVRGKLKEAKNFSDFDYQGYLEMQNVYAVAQYPKILILKNRQQNQIKYGILKLKSAFSERVEKFLPKPQNYLLLGILIGAKKGLPKDVSENFNIVGLSHIVAASGYNISIIILGLRYGARLFGRRLSFWISLGIILGFVVLAGASASIIRAGVMGMLLLIVFQVGRPYKISTAICAAAGLMLVNNPKILYWDIGFQLSFVATLGIVYGMKIFEKRFDYLPEVWKLKSILFSSLCAIVATLPLTLFHFGRVSPYALVVNLLVLPVIPFVMFFGFLTLTPWAGIGFGWILLYILNYILMIANFFSQLTGAGIRFKIEGWQVLLMYLVLILLYFGWHKSGHKTKDKIVQ